MAQRVLPRRVDDHRCGRLPFPDGACFATAGSLVCLATVYGFFSAAITAIWVCISSAATARAHPMSSACTTSARGV
ncbi:hypothetical protein PG985_011041 [Apiospora marii]|uniref:Uncharacterized protein n=1 Tax=Apiospora marii TaxID=335849 RepID=A0ABR1SUC8_9PEZI